MSDFHSIGSFAKVRRGASPRPINNPDFFGGTVGWVRISDVTQRNNKYLKLTQQYLSPLGESCSLRVDAGDLIMSICATVGKPMIVDIPACIHDGFVQIYDINNADVEYLYYLLQFHEKDFEKRGQPGTQVNLNTTIVESEIVFLPHFEQQQKIAKILSTVDKLIEKTQSLIDKYTAVKQGMMADLFTRGIDLTPGDNYGQLRPSVTEAPALYQNSELGWVPKDWEVIPIDEISTQMTNGFVGVATPHYANESDSGIRYLYGNNVRADRLELETVLKIKPEFHQKLRKSQLLHGDMLTVQSGHIGTSAIVPANFGEANCHALIITRLIKSRVIPEFLSYYLNSAIGMNRMEEIFVGSTIKHVNVKELKSFLVPLPSIVEQKNFVLKIIGTHELINNEKQQCEKHKLMKKGLMQDLLTGKIKVN